VVVRHREGVEAQRIPRAVCSQKCSGHVEFVVDPMGMPQPPASVATSRGQTDTFISSSTANFGAQPVIARVLPGAVGECRIDNNTSSPPTSGCIN
jgi:hypothetical protein